MMAKLNLTMWDWVFLVLLVVGGLNWGLVGLAQYDLVATLLGSMSMLSRLVYDLVGLSALYFVVRMLMGMGDMK